MRWSSLLATTLLMSSACLTQPEDLPDQPDAPDKIWPDRPDREADAGSVTVRRLTNDEYNNTVRDLLHTSLRPADRFPADDRAHGWDNIADAQTLSPLHLDMYLQAALELVETEFDSPVVPEQQWFFEAEADMDGSTGRASGTYYNLWSNGTLTGTLSTADAGSYEVTVNVAATQAGPALARAAIMVDGATIREMDIIGDRTWQEFTAPVELSAGRHTVSVAFLNDYYDSSAGADRNLWVDWARVDGPLGVTGEPTAARAEFYTCDPEIDGPDACAETIVSDFARAAWRGPVAPEGLFSVMSVYEDAMALEAPWEEAVHSALAATLVSPRFIFRPELDADPTSDERRDLTAHELASRLSYFLWRSTPDAELRALANDGTLLQDEVIRDQVGRMLDDPKAEAIVDDFAGQWLEIRAIANVVPDYETFPDWDDQLRISMQEEMRLFTRSIVLEDRSMLALLTDEQTFVDARLAQHYGIPSPGDGFHKVTITDHPRVGLLGKAGLLTNLSFPKRTSVTRRGAWVMTSLLCEAPPPAPEGVTDLGDPDLPLRERMEIHRLDPACATCHKVMDPIGFSMENYDGTGAWRVEDSLGFEVDASGSWPGGPSFTNAEELSLALAEDPRIPSCIAQNAFTYALGRPGNVEDLTYINDIQAGFAEGGHRFKSLATEIALSPPFRTRHGEPEEGQ